MIFRINLFLVYLFDERRKAGLWIASIVVTAGKMKQCIIAHLRMIFFVREKHVVVERERTDQGWKKGNPEYEKHRRRVRQNDLEQIG